MKFDKPVSVQWLAEFTGAQLFGDSMQLAHGINEIHMVTHGDISFVDFEKYYDKCLNSAASVIIINKHVPCPAGKTLLVHNDPFTAYNNIVKHFRSFTLAKEMISKDAVIGKDTHIMPGVFIGDHVVIGDHCLIHPNVTIYDHVIIGDHVEIHSGSVIGCHAYYYKRRKQNEVQYDKMISCGRTVIEDWVEIGACCTIDKGVSGDTVIGRGSKLDNQVHIGHDTVTGKNCLFAGQVGIAGVTTIEDEVILWGQVGVNKDLTIGKGAIVYAQSGVPSSLEGGKVYFGSPVDDAKTKMREISWVKRIPEMWQKLAGKDGE